MLCHIRMAWGRQEWWRQFPHHWNACLEYWFDPDYSKRAAPSAHGGIYTGGVRW